MDEFSETLLSGIEQNQSGYSTRLVLGKNHFNSSEVDDYSTLGEHIKSNTHLTTLEVRIHQSETLRSAAVSEGCVGRTFFEGLKQNSSIKELTLKSSVDIVCGVWRPILRSYFQNNNLIRLNIDSISFPDHHIAQSICFALGRCTNLREMKLLNCRMTADQLVPLIVGLRGEGVRLRRCHSLEVLDLSGNVIGDYGCRVLSTLLEDPSCNLHTLDVTNNDISSSGTDALANSLVNNKKLKKLYLVAGYSRIHKQVLHDFTRLVCNTTSISATFCSNHTLTSLVRRIYPWSATSVDEYLSNILTLNEGTNKSNVTIKKILQHNHVIDMTPLFQLDSEDEWSLKLLPYTFAWFEKARKAVSNDIFLPPQTKRELRTRKLSAIYQFAHAMPMLFVPVTHTKVEGKKRKREDNEDT